MQVFCEEVRSGGGAFYRRFVAASYGALWTVYSELRPVCRHFYEARPCRRTWAGCATCTWAKAHTGLLLHAQSAWSRTCGA